MHSMIGMRRLIKGKAREQAMGTVRIASSEAKMQCSCSLKSNEQNRMAPSHGPQFRNLLVNTTFTEKSPAELSTTRRIMAFLAKHLNR